MASNNLTNDDSIKIDMTEEFMEMKGNSTGKNTPTKRIKLQSISKKSQMKQISIEMIDLMEVIFKEENFVGFRNIFESIFLDLDDISLKKCRNVCKRWQNFIDTDKFIWLKRIERYRGSMKKFSDQWDKVMEKTPFEEVNKLCQAVEQFFRLSSTNIENQYAPLHVAAGTGLFKLSE